MKTKIAILILQLIYERFRKKHSHLPKVDWELLPFEFHVRWFD